MIVTSPDGGHRERPGPAPCRREHLVDAAGRLRRRSLRDGGRGLVGPRRGGDVPRRAPDAGPGAALRQDAREARRARRSTTSSTTGSTSSRSSGIPVLISRTGWTAIPGFEVNLLDGSQGDELWNAVAEAGEEFGIKPIAPCEARRIEAGIFNYGSDMTIDDTPLHVMGLERLVEEQPQDYIGKDGARTDPARKGSIGSSSASSSRATSSERRCPSTGRSTTSGREVGHMTDAVWSPGLAKNIGYVWVPIELSAPGDGARRRDRGRRTPGRANGRHPVRRPAEGAACRLVAQLNIELRAHGDKSRWERRTLGTTGSEPPA